MTRAPGHQDPQRLSPVLSMMMEADEVDRGGDGDGGRDGGERSQFFATLKCPETGKHRHDPEQNEVRRERKDQVCAGKADRGPREAVRAPGPPCSSCVPSRLSGLIARVAGGPGGRIGGP